MEIHLTSLLGPVTHSLIHVILHNCQHSSFISGSKCCIPCLKTFFKMLQIKHMHEIMSMTCNRVSSNQLMKWKHQLRFTIEHTNKYSTQMLHLTQFPLLNSQTNIKYKFPYSWIFLFRNFSQVIHSYMNWRQFSKCLNLYFVHHVSVLFAERWNNILLLTKMANNDHCWFTRPHSVILCIRIMKSPPIWGTIINDVSLGKLHIWMVIYFMVL